MNFENDIDFILTEMHNSVFQFLLQTVVIYFILRTISLIL